MSSITPQLQWLRKCSLIVGNPATGKATDLSQLRIRFEVQQRTTQTPNNARIRVYNLAKSTSQAIQNEYTSVLLQGGYVQAQFGTVFEGTIKQLLRGRESAIDDYLELQCADGDIGYNFAVISVAYKAGQTFNDVVNILLKALQPYGITAGYIPQFSATPLPRGKTMHGMVRDVLRDLAATLNVTWSIQNGRLVMVPDNSYLPSEAVVLNAHTGVIGIPEQQVGGIAVRCLLNPRITIGTLIQLDNAAITQTLFKNPDTQPGNPGLVSGQGFNQFGPVILPSTSDDGLYRVLAINHSGDTRGQEWYSDITCISKGGLVPPGAGAQALAGAAPFQQVPGG